MKEEPLRLWAGVSIRRDKGEGPCRDTSQLLPGSPALLPSKQPGSQASRGRLGGYTEVILGHRVCVLGSGCPGPLERAMSGMPMVQWGPKSMSQGLSFDGRCPLSVLNCGGEGSLTCRHEGKGEKFSFCVFTVNINTIGCVYGLL